MRRIAAIGALSLLLAACGDTVGTTLPPDIDPGTVTTAAPPDSTAPATTVAPTTSTAAPTTTTVPPDEGGTTQGPAPWRAAELAVATVPQVLVDQWNAAENRTSCSALYPSEPGEGAVRSANFGGGWAVAWDRTDGPGRFADGNYCDDCGRGAYGVAGVGLPARGDEPDRWADRIEFDDGSLAGYGLEGDADPGSGAPYLMQLIIDAEGCLYNVWSFLGEDHLLELTGSLRFVEGLRGQPTQWQSQQPPPDVQALGAPPWDEPALSPDDIDPIYLLEWEGEANAPASCPLLAFADLGDAASGAVIRRAANANEMLVAWDRPSGPGHDGGSNPCADCGRGAVGLGTFQGADLGDRPVTYTWDDGSRASAAEGFYGLEAHLEVTGFNCTYWIWSHLGEDHLEYLLSQLRRVEGKP